MKTTALPAAEQPVTGENLLPILDTLLTLARKSGADAIDAIATHGRSQSISARDGALEDIDNSEGMDIGLRVFVGQRQACVSSSGISTSSMQQLAERAVAMAKLAPEDPYCSLAAPDKLAGDCDDLDLFDSVEISSDILFERAKTIESAARGFEGITQTDGANAYCVQSATAFVTSHGFARHWRASRHGLSVSAIALRDGGMERDYDYEAARWFTDLPVPESIGEQAAKRALKRLGSRKLASAEMPVVFDRRVASALVSAFLNAISGPAIARGVSFLKNSLNGSVFSERITITDDPYRLRGLGSYPWDGEGVAGRKMDVVKNGSLNSWLLNTASARQLGLQTTGHAVRGTGSPPGVGCSNTYIHAGPLSPGALFRDIGNGLLVMEMFGPSLNANTGDYSVGVAGFKIRDGGIAYPVSEVTVAGNLKDMFFAMTPANDLKFDGAVCAPSLLIDTMVVAGA